MADRKISDLTALTTPASGDYLPIVDISEAAAASKNKRITIQSLFQGIPVNVGIGTASPGVLLDCQGTGSQFIRARTNNTSGSAVAGLSVEYLGGGGGTNSIVDLRAGDAYAILATTTNNPLLFGTNSLERLRVTSAGNVGIGTSIPAVPLDVNGTIRSLTGQLDLDNASQFKVLGLYHSGVRKGFVSYDSTVNVVSLVGEAAGSQLGFYTAGTERLRVTSAGNVGIGTSTPSSPLEVAGQINAVAPFAGFAALQTAAGTGFRWVLNNDGTFFLQRTTDGFATGSISINVDSSNRVGIGTTSPTTLLDVNADTVRVRTARTPASAAATGATGEICWDANYIYVCTATNTWKRSAISTW